MTYTEFYQQFIKVGSAEDFENTLETYSKWNESPVSVYARLDKRMGVGGNPTHRTSNHPLHLIAERSKQLRTGICGYEFGSREYSRNLIIFAYGLPENAIKAGTHCGTAGSANVKWFSHITRKYEWQIAFERAFGTSVLNIISYAFNLHSYDAMSISYSYDKSRFGDQSIDEFVKACQKKYEAEGRDE